MPGPEYTKLQVLSCSSRPPCGHRREHSSHAAKQACSSCFGLTGTVQGAGYSDAGQHAVSSRVHLHSGAPDGVDGHAASDAQVCDALHGRAPAQGPCPIVALQDGPPRQGAPMALAQHVALLLQRHLRAGGLPPVAVWGCGVSGMFVKD